MKMKTWKKIAAAFMVCVFTFTAAPLDNYNHAFAARSGARISIPKVAPAPKTAPAPKAASPNTREYKPSQSANDIKSTAPAASARTNTAAAATQSSSRLGSIMRNVGLFAGGMMLGSLLGHMLGFGAGFLSDILGLLVNVAIFAVIFMAIRALWRRWRGNSQNNDNVYRTERQAMPTFDTPPRRGDVIDIAPPEGVTNTATGLGTDYDAKRVADIYRSR